MSYFLMLELPFAMRTSAACVFFVFSFDGVEQQKFHISVRFIILY